MHAKIPMKCRTKDCLEKKSYRIQSDKIKRPKYEKKSNHVKKEGKNSKDFNPLNSCESFESKSHKIL